jgi:putative membrane protein
VGALRRLPALGPGSAFQAAMVLAGVALFGPIDRWAAGSSAWHMAQHMLLMVVVAPLAVAARPWPVWRAALGVQLDGASRALMCLTRRPRVCALLHALVVWFWHAPAPYLAALEQPGLHGLAHACLLLSAWLLWGSVLRAGRCRAVAALRALLFTLLQTGLLGALLVSASVPWYAAESRDLLDQQLAGLLMAIPGMMASLLGAAWIALHCLPVGTQPPEPRPGLTRRTQ